MISTYKEFYIRDLNKVKDEINLYTREDLMWKRVPGINNSAGNLCLHLIGNLNHFVGMAIGNSGYKRQRELEFSQQNISRSTLLFELDKTVLEVSKAMDSIDDSYLKKIFPLDKHGENVTYDYMLGHLLTHLNYHLGQINYHRRFIDS